MTSPATTAATSPEAPSNSAGTAARNGTVNEMTVLTVESVIRLRIERLSQLTSSPITIATTTEYANVPTAPQNENAAAAATIAVRSSTSAVASLSRLSPSSIATTRFDTEVPRTMDVATASVGLMIAPSATPHANPRSGSTSMKNTPSTSELATTSTTERPLIAPNSRRKFIDGIDTAAE